MKLRAWLVLPLLLAAGTACRKPSHSPFQVTAVAQGAAPVTQSAAPARPKLPPAPTGEAVQKPFSVPGGTPLPVVPGRGVGPIRFGASPATIERLMQAKCTTQEDNICRYAPHAVDFIFADGKLAEIHLQGDERPFPGGGGTPDGTYGAFNGALPKGVMFGMYADAVVKEFSEPQRTEPLNPPQGATVMRHYYPNNMVFEYDKIANGNVVLEGVILKPDEEAIAAAREAALKAMNSANPAGSAAPAPSAKSTAKSKSKAKPTKPVKPTKPRHEIIH